MSRPTRMPYLVDNAFGGIGARHVIDDDPRAVGSQPFCYRSADSARRSGDKDGLAHQWAVARNRHVILPRFSKTLRWRAALVQAICLLRCTRPPAKERGVGSMN